MISRSPKAPKSLTDLLNTIKELPDAYRYRIYYAHLRCNLLTIINHIPRASGESLDAAIVESLEDVATVFKPLVLVVDQMIK